MQDVRHPEVPPVKLIGTDGNAFAVLGKVTSALEKAGVGHDEISLFTEEATRGDYDELLITILRWVEVE
jgi:hypothetical protein